jgi:transcriptional regulator with XRE-family HTH domain
MEIGESIKLVRAIAGLTQEQMANRLDVSATHLSLVENGKSNPSLSLLQRVEDEFGVPKSFLVWNSHFQAKTKDPALSKRYRLLGEQMLELATTLIRRASTKAKE